MNFFETVIIGAGASGLMTASLLRDKRSVLIMDGNKTPGRKIAVSGGGTYTMNAGRLEALGPLAVLQRGYSVTRIPATGQIIGSADQAPPGQTIETILHRGRLLSKVTEAKSPEEDE